MPKGRESTEVDRQLGRRLGARRAALGWTRGQVATQVGVTVQQLQKYETGANRVSASRLVRLATVLGLSAGDLLADLDNPSQSPERDGADLAQAAARIGDARARAALLTLAHALAG